MKISIFLTLWLMIAGCSFELKSNLSDDYTGNAGGLHEKEILPQYLAKSKKAMVTTSAKISSEIGKMVLDMGGNAVDATVAVSFALSVETPQSTGIGGGGFALVAMQGKPHRFFDFRERAPIKAKRTMYENAPEKNNSENGPLAVAVPGLVSGLEAIHKRYGVLPWHQLVQPSIDLAEQGFPIPTSLAEALKDNYSLIIEDSNMRDVFLNDHGELLNEGDILIQKKLGETLRKIQKAGANAFYEGQFPKKVVEHFGDRGIIQETDFKLYKTRERDPITIKFNDYEISTAPSPSSGGIVLAQLLNMVELKNSYGSDLERTHYYSEMMKLAYIDRSKWMGDDQFVSVPIDRLISKAYAKEQFKRISDSKIIVPDSNEAMAPESPSTTHFNIVDEYGNVVASTQTINTSFGSKIMVEGVVLNNEMDDFSLAPGVPNAYGLIGSYQNAIQAGKTPLSSMTPTIVTRNKKFVLSIGAAGGSHIISTVFLTMSRLLLENYSPKEALIAKRYHHQGFPNEVRMEEDGFNKNIVFFLEKLGHKVSQTGIWTRMTYIFQDSDYIYGAVDTKTQGQALGY